LLMAGNDQITAGPGRQVTDECRYDVDAFHRGSFRLEAGHARSNP
jgi:hypothetical protein